jgi:nitrite reductase (NADH) small subunit
MTHEIALGRSDQIPLGEGRTFAAGDKQIAVFRTRAGGVYAVQALCPHKGGPLADGLVGGETVVCPLHDRVFDLRTGQGPEPECGLEVYPVTLGDDGRIWLELPS